MTNNDSIKTFRSIRQAAMPFDQWLFVSKAPKATLLIRLLVGLVFLSEGIQKFLFPETLGFGRFAKIGIPAPSFTAPFVGAVEIVLGVLMIIGSRTANRVSGGLAWTRFSIPTEIAISSKRELMWHLG